MPIRTIDELIADVPAFAGMREDQLETIAGCATNVQLEADSHLFRHGDAANTFYVMRTGSVALELFVPAHEPVTLQTLHEGDLIGWSWLFPPYRWQFDAHVLEPSRAISFDGACLRGKCDADHELGYELMRRFAQVMTERLQATRLQLMDVYGRRT
jgi:CRP/FNR family transcriptional regulator, cyclic AMP receptor protein